MSSENITGTALQGPEPESRPAEGQRHRNRLPPGHRVLHVILPEHVFNHAKAQAALSGMPFKTYMERFLQEAFPYNRSQPAHPTGV